MSVRNAIPDDRDEVLEFRRLLWPDGDDDNADETVFVWQRVDGRLGGFVSISIRPWAEGCRSTPVPFIEGWFVSEDLRRTGVGRALFEAVEEWARSLGYAEIGSDARLDNVTSLRAHRRLGYQPTERLQYFRKDLRMGGDSRPIVVDR